MSNVTVSAVEEFKQAMSQGLSKIYEACKIYVSEIQKGNKVQFQKSLPEIPEQAWIKFELIGRGQLHQRLLYGGGAAQSAVSVLPMSQQEDVINNGVELLLTNGETLNVSVENLTRLQIKQVFNSGNIRSIAAQRAWLESEKTHKSHPAINRDTHKVTKKGLEVFDIDGNPFITFSRIELLAFLQQMG
jgi:hypothetical protein